MSTPDVKDILLGLSNTLNGWFEELLNKMAKGNSNITHKLDTIIEQNNQIIKLLSSKNKD